MSLRTDTLDDEDVSWNVRLGVGDNCDYMTRGTQEYSPRLTRCDTRRCQPGRARARELDTLYNSGTEQSVGLYLPPIAISLTHSQLNTATRMPHKTPISLFLGVGRQFKILRWPAGSRARRRAEAQKPERGAST